MAKGFAKIRDTDRGYKHIKAQFRAGSKGIEVDVGILSEDGQNQKAQSAQTTIAEVALIHEFGAPDQNIPSRSFLRSTVDENNDFRTIINRLFSGIILKRLGLARAMELLGMDIESKIKNKIRAGIEPALKAATAARKGSTKPLVDTGQLLRSIKSKVRRG